MKKHINERLITNPSVAGTSLSIIDQAIHRPHTPHKYPCRCCHREIDNISLELVKIFIPFANQLNSSQDQICLDCRNKDVKNFEQNLSSLLNWLKANNQGKDIVLTNDYSQRLLDVINQAKAKISSLFIFQNELAELINKVNGVNNDVWMASATSASTQLHLTLQNAQKISQLMAENAEQTQEIIALNEQITILNEALSEASQRADEALILANDLTQETNILKKERADLAANIIKYNCLMIDFQGKANELFINIATNAASIPIARDWIGHSSDLALTNRVQEIVAENNEQRRADFRALQTKTVEIIDFYRLNIAIFNHGNLGITHSPSSSLSALSLSSSNQLSENYVEVVTTPITQGTPNSNNEFI
jgi:hypothetical protein